MFEDDTLHKAYNSYFGNVENSNPSTPKQSQKISYTETKNDKFVMADTNESINGRLVAEDNIDDVDELAELIRQILNAAWGSKWGQFAFEFQEGDDPENITLPQITYDLESRVISDKRNIKPVLTDTVAEIINGEPTGDTFNIYRQWFDCIMEFDIWGRNALEARKLMKQFETLISTTSGLLKQRGISEIIFRAEDPAYESSKFRPKMSMRCLKYFVRIERITSVRLSTLQVIELALTPTTPDKINTVGQQPTYNQNTIKEQIVRKL